MKRLIAAVATGLVMAASAGALAASAGGVPEVDATAANIQVKPLDFRSVSCAGEDSTNYVTYTGTWKGTENDAGGPTDYSPMSGPLTVKGIVWTINLSTGRGVLHGTATLVGASGVGAIYSGPLTLVTQGIPSSTGNGVQARGWIAGATFTAGAKDGGSLLANVELQILPSLAANGEFGGPTMGFQDFSAVTDNIHC